MIKGRLKHTASFFALWFPVYGSVMVCASAMASGVASGCVGYGSFLVCYACAVSDQKKMIVVSAVNVV